MSQETKIAKAGLLVAAVSCIAALAVVPELRLWERKVSQTTQEPVNVPPTGPKPYLVFYALRSNIDEPSRVTLKGDPLLRINRIREAAAIKHKSDPSYFALQIELEEPERRALLALTTEYTGRMLAATYDDEVVCLANVRGPKDDGIILLNDQGLIDGIRKLAERIAEEVPAIATEAPSE